MKDDNKFVCPICDAKIGSRKNLNRHIKGHTKVGDKKCRFCSFKSRADNVKRHEVHKNKPVGAQVSQPPEASRPQAATRGVTIATQTDEENVEQASSSVQQDVNTQTPMDTTERDDPQPEEDLPMSTVELIEEQPSEEAADQTHGDQAEEEPMSTVELEEQPLDVEETQTSQQSETQSEANSDGQGDQWVAQNHYSMTKINTFYSNKWKTENSNYEIRINPLPSDGWQQRLLLILQHVLKTLQSRAPPGSMGRIVVFINGVQYPINDRVDGIHQLNLQQLLERIEKVLNSSQSADITKGFRVNIIFTEMSAGGGMGSRGVARSFHGRSVLDPEDWSFRKTSMLNPAAKAKDNLCMPRCLVIGMTLTNVDTLKDVDGKAVTIKHLYNSERPVQRKRAEHLCEKAGVAIGPKCDMNDLHKFQAYLNRYQIVVFEEGRLTPIYKGSEYKDMQIFLYLSNHHYSVINPRMFSAFFGKNRSCRRCFEAWSSNGPHQCSFAPCYFCKNSKCDNRSKIKSPKTCDSCDCTFLTTGCFVAHQAKECAKMALCPTCKKFVKRTELDPRGYKPRIDQPQSESLHGCLANRCFFCYQSYMPGFHQFCFLQKPKSKKADEVLDENAEEGVYELLGDRDYEEGRYETDGPGDDGTCRETEDKSEREMRVIYMDFETELNGSFHKPNLLCLEEDNGTKHTYVGPTCAADFVKDGFLKRAREPEDKEEEGPPRKKRKKAKEGKDIGFKDCTFVAHNFAGFDSYPILHELHVNKIKPNTLFRGSRMLSLRLPQRRIRFVDSYLHTNLALCDFPKAYGLTDKSKGHFPYKMATASNRHYKGRLPELAMYDGDNMPTKKRNGVVRWYDDKRKEYEQDPTLEFDMEKENIEYCRNDTSMLHEGVDIHRNRMKAMFQNEDPLHHLTLPSYCNYVWRKLMMPEQSVAILEPRGFGKGKWSAAGVAWCEYMQYKLGLKVTHARNGKEVIVGGYRVDGFCWTKSGGACILEFNVSWCWWHGHKACQKNRAKLCMNQTMDERHEYTMQREDFLKNAGYAVISIYECEMYEQMKKDPEMNAFISPLMRRLKSNEPLNPRKSLQGGRTNAIRKFYKPAPNETIEYHDINSLYPSVMFGTHGEEWPLGPPSVYLTDFPPVEEIFGLIQGTLRPPDRLYHPCMGMPANDKLIHGLCATCAHEGAKTHCKHTDDQRDIHGVFVSEELKLCLKKGYKLMAITEVWHFKSRSKDLFKSFISSAYRYKLESSGWPTEIQQLIDQHGVDHEQTQEQIQQYKQKIKDDLGIDIRDEFVEHNPARRQVAKLVLNNFWGFFAKAPGKEQTKYIESLDEFYKLLTTKDVGSYNLVNDDLMVVRFKEPEHLETPDPKTSVVIAAFTTAYARMRLYYYLDLVGDRCLYLDTDSIIWINRIGMPTIESADLLGLMKNEITSAYGPQGTIGAFGAAGPKSYTLMIVSKETGEVLDWHRRLKGISPSFKVDQKLPSEKLLDLIEKEYEITVPQRTLHRYKLNTTLEWRETDKVVRSTFGKRLAPANITDPTDPIGSRALVTITVTEH